MVIGQCNILNLYLKNHSMRIFKVLTVSNRCKYKDTSYMTQSCGQMPFMILLETLITSRVDLTGACWQVGTDTVPRNKR